MVQYRCCLVGFLTLSSIQSFQYPLPTPKNRKDCALRAKRVPQSRPRPQRSPPSRRTKPFVQRRAPHQFDHTQEEARPFVRQDTKELLRQQDPNEDAPCYALNDTGTTSSDTTPSQQRDDESITHPHLTYYSLDDIFPNNLNFSERFNSNADFRTELRNAMREDVLDTTPTYHTLSEKARNFLLLPDSSLQGSWKCVDGGWSRSDGSRTMPRMTRLTHVLAKHLGADAPTGDEFMDTIGRLCGDKPSTHWIDIVGVLNRRIPHSWHQDTGRSDQCRTVLLGFPASDQYEGVGVFSHLIKLKYEQWAHQDHPPQQPIVYELDDDDDDDLEDYIVRPLYQPGREIVVYRDVDVLHSSPDIALRSSVMRFM